MALKLHFHPLSGHSHRVQLFLSLINQPVEIIEVDLAKGAHKSAEFLKLNPFGQIPVLEDGDVVLADSNAILVYLAKKFARTDWLPEDPVGAARVQRWLSIAAGQIAFGPAAARLVTVFGAKFDANEVISRAHNALRVIDQELARTAFLTGATPTIADVAAFSYIARAPEGNVSLADYPQVRRWLAAIEALPGFVAMRRTPVGLAA